MSKLQDKLFGKVTIRKKLTMTTAVVFFLVLSMFTLVVIFSANTLLLQRERQNVNTTISGEHRLASRYVRGKQIEVSFL